MQSSFSGPLPADSSKNKEVVIKINGRDMTKDTVLSSSQSGQPTNPSGSENSATRRTEVSSYRTSNDPVMMEKAKGVDNVNSHISSDFVSTFASLSTKRADSPNYGQISGRGVKIACNENEHEPIRHRVNVGVRGRKSGEKEEVLLCSSNSSFGRKSSLLRTKTKSRLMDLPEQDQQHSRVLRSTMLGKGSKIDEDDPFWEEDLPEKYKRMRLSAFTVFQLLSMIIIIAAFVCSLTIQVLKKIHIFDLELWKWEVMILVLICGRLVSGWGIRIVVLLIERNFLLRKRVLYFVYGLRNAVQNCIWLAFVLIAWLCIFDRKVDELTNKKVLPYVTRIWVCLLVGTFIWLLKTLILKVLAMSFHVTTFFDRIHESLFNQYIIETLSGQPLVEIQEEQEVLAEIQNFQNAGAKLPADLKENLFPGIIGTPQKGSITPKNTNAKNPISRVMSKKDQEKTSIPIDHLHRLNQKNISAWNMKRMINIVRQGMASTLHDQLQDSVSEDESAVQITSENQAKAAAKKIFNNVAKPGSKCIYLEDLKRFLREDEALKTLHLFEGGTENKGISKKALKNFLVNVFRERRALALSLDDTKTAVKKLHQMLNVFVAIIILIIWLLILKVTTTKFFIILSSQVLLVVFIFGNSCKTTFEAIIFLFVMHPFDVGDRVEVDGVQMVVDEMNMLTTVFLRFDYQKIIYPNSILATKPISNYNRSPHMKDAIDFSIHISTPVEKIAEMKGRITRYIEGKSEHWHAAPMIFVRDVEDMNRIKWSVWPVHTMNFQDIAQRWVRRAVLIEEMIKIFRELDIEYRLLPRDINVRDMPPLTSSRHPSNWTTCA